MKISYLIFISIFFILTLFSITTYVNYNQSEKVRENARFASLSTNYVRQTNLLQRNILEIERILRGYFLTGENYLLQSYNTIVSENPNLFLELKNLSAANNIQITRITAISDLYDQWISQYQDSISVQERLADSVLLARSPVPGRISSLNQSSRQEEIFDKMQEGFSELRNSEYENREIKRKILEDSEYQTKVISFSLTALSIVIGFIVAYLLARHISRRIKTMVTMADSIAKGNYKAQVANTGMDELGELSHSLNHMAETLAENISQHQRKNRELDQFAHIVSHDLKAPLRGIDNVVSWIEEDHGKELPNKVNEYLGLIKGRIVRLENLIQGILSYALIGKEVQPKEKVMLQDLVEEIFESLPVKPGLRLETPVPLPIITTNKLPLSQVLTNLVSNSVKYHDKDSGFIRIHCTDKTDHFLFSVEDNGPGIAAIYHDKIFVIFQTLQDRDSFESTGVGLAIVKKILDDRKEKITVTSKPGEGVQFEFTWGK